jgi:hypothetical protein
MQSTCLKESAHPCDSLLVKLPLTTDAPHQLISILDQAPNRACRSTLALRQMTGSF